MTTVVLCPTRDRCDSIVQMVDSFLNTSSGARLVLICDDDQRADYWKVMPQREGRVILSSVRRNGPAIAAKQIAEQINPDIYGVVPDDVIFETKDWDRHLEEDVQPHSNVPLAVSPHTGYHTERLEMPFVNREWVRRVGSLVPLTVRHFCWNTCIAMLAQSLGPDGILQMARERFSIRHLERPTSREFLLNEDAARFYWWCVFDYPGMLKKLRGVA